MKPVRDVIRFWLAFLSNNKTGPQAFSTCKSVVFFIKKAEFQNVPEYRWGQ
ncbi:hypothetical protein FC65_GL000295 [Ligilactobacillus acidipiscis DSM 15836]|uniref:Uncharacterized protein n=1 Tax=Ligilactobacillus acidipiscis DSM 15836 TaxID=1423716 RepID=A0ABR5PJ05_9LACO|nr:hypothetical protein FC65_GL000295 [Ligilactobacillus acidipiscis DSM 15836]